MRLRHRGRITPVIRPILRQALLVLCTAVIAAPAYAKPASKLLLQDLSAVGVEGHEAKALSTATCGELAKRKGYQVMCGDDLRAMIKWNAMAASFNACDGDDCLAKTASAVDARYVVSGSVAKVGDDVVLSLVLLNTEKGVPVGRASIRAPEVAALHRQVREAVDILLSKGTRKRG